MPKVQSCDTFVVLPPSTQDGFIIFGKNSDRPNDEVQEIVYVPAQKHAPGSKLSCTFIDIEQSQTTNAVILSKPSWMWGAEMGSNEHGVVVGNEAVWTKMMNDVEDRKEKLLGMDLLRLGLERSSTAMECLHVITSLLEKHGQGGPCSEDQPDMTYHNSFLIVDRKEAYVLETAGCLWVAEKIESGARNISNNLTITTKIDLASPNVKELAQKNGWWNGFEPFNFAKAYSASGEACDQPRQKEGEDLLKKFTSSNSFGPSEMMKILRDKSSGICMQKGGSFVSSSSQVSIIAPAGKQIPSVHFFTGTPDPSVSVFKPFVFAGDAVTQASLHILSPKLDNKDDPAKKVPRFETKVDRRHALYKCHQAAFFDKKHPRKTPETLKIDLESMENQCLEDICKALKDGTPIVDAETLFKDAVDAEIKIYKY